jgi:predicted ATP-grasp superfamily ATP-dependent carboligase
MAVPLLNARLDAAAIVAGANASDLTPAIVCNTHITGLAVARSLAKHGVPVIGLDREPYGVGLASNALAGAGVCSDPISQPEEFVLDLLAIGAELKRPAVLFGCMDEWVLALNAHREQLEQFFIFPFAGDEIVRDILDKSVLYRAASKLGVPIPKSLDTREHSLETVLAEIGVPSILKPAAKRPFYDAFGINLFTPKTEDEFKRQLSEGGTFGMIAQEIIPATFNDYVTVAVALAPGGRVLGSFAGQRLEIFPAGFGTTCLAKPVDQPELEARAITVLQQLDYHGIAECEFLRDPRTGEFNLLDINTRPWKWIGLPIASGVELPWQIYAEATGQTAKPAIRRNDLVWVSVKDYVPLRASGQAMQPGDPIGKERWLSLISGQLGDGIIDAILDPSDPEPFYRALLNAFGEGQYSCPC